MNARTTPIRRLCSALAIGIFALALAGCGRQELLSDVTVSAPALRPSDRDHVDLRYTIGRAARVTIYLQDAAGTRYMLRHDEPRLASDEPYLLRFDGTVPTDDPVVRRRLLPGGAYQYVVEAAAEDGSHARASGQLTIEGDDIQPPMIDDLVVFPQTISPNADAVDDIAEITYRLPVTATVDITIVGPDGRIHPFVTGDEEGPELHKHVWNGRTVDGMLLEDGVYTYTVQAQDRYGNLVQRQGTMAIQGGGQPEATITYSYIAPQAVMRGEVITVTMRVKNTGDVPIRTYGPPSGYEYSTEEVFSSVEEGQYAARPGGFWRVGMDWDANSGGAAKRYPYRWAISPRPPDQWRVPHVEDVLMPGEEAEVIGRIRIFQPETRMGFYVGLIQDGVGFFQDKTGRTIVEVGF